MDQWLLAAIPLAKVEDLLRTRRRSIQRGEREFQRAVEGTEEFDLIREPAVISAWLDALREELAATVVPAIRNMITMCTALHG